MTDGDTPGADEPTIDTPTEAPTPSSRGAEAATPSPLPRTAGRYPIDAELGRGGMGVVYLATDPDLGRRVAIKRLPAHLATSADRLERFRQEARTLASLNHPNIATIHSLEEDDTGTFLTMEAIEGETLRARLRRGPLDVAEALRVSRQVARGLEAAHRGGVVHRDLKPGNVMFTAHGDVKVLDFGLATPSRRTANISGTPGYMSPEQIQGEVSDPRMDVWAFGCLLFECLTGSRAIPGESSTDRLQNTLEGAIDLDRVDGRVPTPLRRLLTQCLDRSLDVRPPSMTEPRRAIESLLAEVSLFHARARGEPTDGSSPNNLPRHAASLVGREQEIHAVQTLLAENRLVTLTGIGGVGKTRLSLSVAQTLLDDRLDEAWFVELAPLTTSGDVANTLMKAIGVPEVFERPALESVTAYLSTRKAVVVLDNCEHVLDGTADVVRALLRSAPDVRILVTSRERLAIDEEASFPVPRLAVPATHGAMTVTDAFSLPAVELFVQRAKQLRPDFALDDENVKAVVEICRRLDGIPLAIELAASRVRVLSVEDVLARLDDRFRLLTGGDRKALPQHRTLRAMIDWSVDQLTPAERTLLARLSVFRGGWTLSAAEEVAAGGCVEDWDVLDLSARLVDRSLIEADTASDGSTRFRMLETVNAYAAEQLEASGEAQALGERHRDHFAAFVAGAEPELTGENQVRTFARLDEEFDNIRGALEACARPGVDPMIGLSIAGSLFRFWLVRGHWNEAYDTSRAVLERAADKAPTAHHAKVLNMVATVAYYHGRSEDAEDNWQKVIDVWSALGNEPGVASAKMNLAGVAYARGDYAAAEKGYLDALARVRASNDLDGMGRALVNLGSVAISSGDHDAGRRYSTEAIELLRGRHAELLAHALVNAGTAELRLDNPEAARALYEESLEIQETLGDKRNRAIATVNLGVVFNKLGRLGDSRRAFLEALDAFHRLGEQSSIASAIEGLALLAVDMGKPAIAPKAIGATNAARAACGSPRMPQEETVVDEALERLRRELGEPRVAELLSEGERMDLEAAVAWIVREMG